MQRQGLFLAIVVLCAAAATLPADRYVAQAGQTPASPYDAWSNAASNLQTAVNAAAAGETVWVSNGLYRATSSPVVAINKSLSLRSVVTNSAAVIDGEGARRCIQITIAEPMQVVVEGFTITNGAGVGLQIGGVNKWPAGGILAYNTADVTGTTLDVRNCVIRGNRSGNTANGEGGGMLVWALSATDDIYTRVANCEIVGNYSGTGGAGIQFMRGRFLVEQCRIAGNVVDVWDPLADPPVAAANTRGGGGISANYAGPCSILRDCVFEDNRASRWGGGVLARYDGDLRVENCSFLGNIAPSGAGILIAQHSGDPTNILRNCLFARNWALTNNITTSYGYGGGLQIGDVTLLAGRNVRLENCTVAANTSRVDGAGVRIYTANGLAAVNSIVYGNVTSGNVRSNYYGTAAWTNCLVGTGDVLPGSGNLASQDPAFVDPDSGNYRLRLESPCVDAGFYLSWMDTARDLDGRPRIHGSTATVDLGCYENPLPGTVLFVR